jgi:hypothetical protein
MEQGAAKLVSPDHQEVCFGYEGAGRSGTERVGTRRADSLRPYTVGPAAPAGGLSLLSRLWRRRGPGTTIRGPVRESNGGPVPERGAWQLGDGPLMATHRCPGPIVASRIVELSGGGSCDPSLSPPMPRGRRSVASGGTLKTRATACPYAAPLTLVGIAHVGALRRGGACWVGNPW